MALYAFRGSIAWIWQPYPPCHTSGQVDLAILVLLWILLKSTQCDLLPRKYAHCHFGKKNYAFIKSAPDHAVLGYSWLVCASYLLIFYYSVRPKEMDNYLTLPKCSLLNETSNCRKTAKRFRWICELDMIYLQSEVENAILWNLSRFFFHLFLMGCIQLFSHRHTLCTM